MKTLLDSLWLALLALFVIAGREAAPFHGDESLHIYMSRDYAYLVQQRTLEPVLYHDTARDELDALNHHLRIVNGTLNKMLIGLAWDAGGLTVDDLNGPWFWGLPDEWAWNEAEGHLPDDRLLSLARWPSVLLTVLSVVAVFGVARQVAGNRPGAWLASLLYTTSPAVLLNGRRAMAEGALLFFSTPVVFIALRLMISLQREGRPGLRVLALGVASGLAVASKHNAVITVVAAFLAVLTVPLPGGWTRAALARRARYASYGLVAGLLALVVFLVLNPAWWADPLRMPGRVLSERQALLDQQQAGAETYDGFPARVVGLLDEAFFAEPQFYEVPAWADYISDEIDEYRASGLAGRSGLVWGALFAGLTVLGVGVAGWRWRTAAAWGLLVWLGVTALAILLLTPFAWQRYYLPLQPPLAVAAGVGFGWLVEQGQRVVWRVVERLVGRQDDADD